MGYLPTARIDSKGKPILSHGTGTPLVIALAAMYADNPEVIGDLLCEIAELADAVEVERELDGAGNALPRRDELVDLLVEECGGGDIALDTRPVVAALWMARGVAHEARQIAKFADAHAVTVEVAMTAETAA